MNNWEIVKSGNVSDDQDGWVEGASESCDAEIMVIGVGRRVCENWDSAHSEVHRCEYNYGQPERFMIEWSDNGNYEVKKRKVT